MNKIAALSIFYQTRFLLNPLYNSFTRNSGITADFYIYDNSRNPNLRLQKDDVNGKNLILKYFNPMIFQNIYASRMHCLSIQLTMNDLNISNYEFLILLDSDVIITHDLSHIIQKMRNDNYDIAGWHDQSIEQRNLIHPSLLFIKTKNILEKKIQFFDPKRIIVPWKDSFTYDTGMSFYEDVCKAGLKVLELEYNVGYNHFCAGCRQNQIGLTKSSKSKYSDINKWLKDFEPFWK